MILKENERENLLASLSGNYYHKKCPFCGTQSEETQVKEIHNKFRVVCDNCNAMGPKADDIDSAREKWNKRIDDPQYIQTYHNYEIDEEYLPTCQKIKDD